MPRRFERFCDACLNARGTMWRMQRITNTAVDILRDGPIDLVLTDLQMPGRSGVELARLVVRDFPGIKVIAMSGFEDAHLSRLPRELHIDAAVTKPMQPEVLIGAIRAALQKKVSRAV